MDYFHRLNRASESALTRQEFHSDNVQNPVTYEEWESNDGNKIGFKATSSYNSATSCATRLITYFYAQGVEDKSMIVRKFDSNGVPEMWVPKGTQILTEVEPYDTSGVTNTQYKRSVEPQNERAGVNVETYRFNNEGLDITSLNIMKQERPDLFNFSDFDLEDFGDWWLEFNRVFSDTVNRVFSSNVELYLTPIAETRIKGDGGTVSRTMSEEGLYSIHSIYGYDWEAEVDSQKASWELGRGDDFLGLSWSGVGYWALTGVYYATFVWTFFRRTLTYAYLPKVAHVSVKGVAKFALACAETVAIDIFLMELPDYVRSVDVSHNHNICGFPAGGLYEKINLHVYDSSVRDWQGTPHCKSGESRPTTSDEPLTYDPEVPCCPEGATYNKSTSLCEMDGEATVPDGGGSTPPTTNALVVNAPTETLETKILAGLLLGVVGITVISGLGGSK